MPSEKSYRVPAYVYFMMIGLCVAVAWFSVQMLRKRVKESWPW